MQPNFFAGALVNSALYLLCVFAAGIVTGHPFAWRCAIAAMGVTYLAHLLALKGIEAESARLLCHEPGRAARLLWFANAVVGVSIALGLAAGLALLV